MGKENDENNAKHDELREQITKAVATARAWREALARLGPRHPQGRHLALVSTKLEEALLWAGASRVQGID